jgi:hypothetical protein
MSLWKNRPKCCHFCQNQHIPEVAKKLETFVIFYKTTQKKQWPNEWEFAQFVHPGGAAVMSSACFPSYVDEKSAQVLPDYAITDLRYFNSVKYHTSIKIGIFSLNGVSTYIYICMYIPYCMLFKLSDMIVQSSFSITW